MTLRDLIALAYGLKPYQVAGPEWLAGLRFDILARSYRGGFEGRCRGCCKRCSRIASV